jgi:hypothetical protein
VWDIPVKLAVLGAVAWAVWKLVQPRSVFVIDLVDGDPRVTSGKVTPAALNQLASICREQGVLRGRIRGVMRRDRSVALRFSREFSPGVQQQIRNWWATMV